MEWWDDLWLNEGFATFIQYKALDHVFNSWNAFSLFLPGDLHPALRADSQVSSSSVVRSVFTPDQITAMFDTIRYKKGASLFYMIENIIGKEAFQMCTRNYLKSNKFGNVDTSGMIKHFNDHIKRVG